MSQYKTVSPADVAASIERGDEVFIVDVREPRQFHAGHLPDAILLPSDTFADRYTRELSEDDPIIIVCERGLTSDAAARFLASQGFVDVATMEGGMQAWTGPLVTTR